MDAKMKNPGLQPRAFREGQALHAFDACTYTLSDRRAQLIARRFRLKPWIASDLVRLCFGEGRND